jgi:hypothetical protein
MRKKFCCESSRHLYEQYYDNQAGSGISVFQGSYGQRGHGIGSTLAGLFRSALPMVKRGLAAFGKQALNTGLNIASDMADGKSFSDSAGLRARQGIKRLATEGIDYLNNGGQSEQTGSGYKRRRQTRAKRKRFSQNIAPRRRTTRKRKGSSKRKTKRGRKRRANRVRDIFD